MSITKKINADRSDNWVFLYIRIKKRLLRIPKKITKLQSKKSKLKGEIVDSLESGGGIPEEVRWEIEDLLMEKNVSYVVFAYFDVGVPDKDAATGNQIVNVALTIAEITRLGDGDPVSLGTISCVQMRGQGSDNSVAKNNAINKVANETAKKLVALIYNNFRYPLCIFGLTLNCINYKNGYLIDNYYLTIYLE